MREEQGKGCVVLQNTEFGLLVDFKQKVNGNVR